MRYVFIAAGAAMILSACGAPPPQAPAPPAPAVGAFPNVFQTAYRAEAIMIAPDGAQVSIVLLRDGPKTRVEAPATDGPVFQVTDRTSGETVAWQHVRGRAILLPPPDAPAPARVNPQAPPPPVYVLPDLWWLGDVAAAMSSVGACSHLGESGGEWERDSDAGPQHVCVSADGIVLWATNNGQTVWQLTNLQRGAQEPSQFELPASARPAQIVEAPIYDDKAAYVPPQFPPPSDLPAPQNH